MVPRIEPTDGFRTLGVYLTPAGQYKKQVKILRAHAEMFKDQLMSSSLTQSEAYCCYMIYIRPKISYPLPCVSLTEQQCRHIQAPILEAILPKLHLNHHSPRAVLFASSRYRGIGLAENYADFGFCHLQYMIGHLKMQDDVGVMLLSLITHTQLQVVLLHPFLSAGIPTLCKMD